MDDYIKVRNWNGKDLKGIWEVTFKIDGVRVLVRDGVPSSRAGKPLYNLPELDDGDYEVYTGSWDKTITAVRTHDSEEVSYFDLYDLDPLDLRLHWCHVGNPTSILITTMMEHAVSEGYEGLVLRQGDRWLKVKPVETYDVPITGHYGGKGKYTGMLGGFYTDRGKVGTGITDSQRLEYMVRPLPVGTVIEVDCMSLTKSGKFRHSRLVRIRYDKSAEDCV